MSDPDIQGTFSKSKLYILAQRPILSFRNFMQDNEQRILRFEIHQGHAAHYLLVTLPLVQKYILSNLDEPFTIRYGTLYPPEITPRKDCHSLMIWRGEEHVITLWPERLLLFNHRGLVQSEIKGDMREFLKYKVLYVGKAIDQRVWKRLDGHGTLQRILSEEMPLITNDLPTHEIALIFLEFHDNLSIQILGHTSTAEQITKATSGEELPDADRIYTDAEKALIRALQPSYNRVRYVQYPRNRGGLYRSGFDTYSYTFMDPITLAYNDISIHGGLNHMGGDAIVVQGDIMYVPGQGKPSPAGPLS